MVDGAAMFDQLFDNIHVALGGRSLKGCMAALNNKSHEFVILADFCLIIVSEILFRTNEIINVKRWDIHCGVIILVNLSYPVLENLP